MSEATGGLSDPIDRAAWERQDKEPELPYSARMFTQVMAEVATVTEADIAQAEQDLPPDPQNLGELGECPLEVRKLYAYIQRSSREHPVSDENVPLDVRLKRQIAMSLSYGALEAAFPTPKSAPGQPWVCRGWRVVFVPDTDGAATMPAGQA